MPLIAPVSELEAVNRMLESIGQSPVNSINVSGLDDVSTALNALRDISRDVQTYGYAWNTDDNWELSPTVDDYILIPQGAMDVDPMDPKLPYTVRYKDGVAQLWDGDNLTWTFAKSVYCRIIWALPFEELPQVVRTYVATKAGRRFQARRVESAVLERFNLEDEQSAWLLLQRRERATRDTNMFRANPRLRSFYRRSDRGPGRHH